MLFKKSRRIFSSVLSVILAAPLLAIVTAPNAQAVANLQLSRGIQGEGVGRAGEAIQFEVYSKLANGSTTSTDVIYAWLEGVPSGVTYTPEIILPTSTDISNSIQHASFTIPVTTAGNYTVLYCATSSTVQPTMNYGDETGAPSGGNWTHIRICNAKTVSVAGAPSLISIGERTIYSNPVINTRTSNSIHIGLFDETGTRTLLKSGESLNISMAAGQVSATSATSGSALSQQITLTNTSASTVGTYRAYLGNSAQASQEVTVAGGGAISALTAAKITLDTRTRAGVVGQTPNLTPFSNGVFGTGSDGDLYRWGVLRSGMIDNVSGSDVFAKSFIKPTKVNISSGARAQKLWSCSSLYYTSGCGAYGFLAEDGSLWADGADNGSFALEQRLTGELRPLILPLAASLKIVDVSFGARVVVISDGSVWKRNDNFSYSKINLSSISAPIIKNVIYLWASETTIMLADNGEIYSVGGNAQGQLGQGSDSAASLGKVVLPAGKIVTKIFGGESWAGAQFSTGQFVTWGRNDRGQQGKTPAEVPYLNTPRTLVTPGEINVTRIDGIDRGVVAYGTNAAGIETAYLAREGIWSEVRNYISEANLPATSGILSFYTDTNEYRAIIVDSDFKVYQRYMATGNCDSTNGRIRSDGAFGPVWYQDPLSYGTRLLTIGSNVTQVPDVVTVNVGDTFTVQVANVRTKCYSASELIYGWDRDGNGTYETPDTAVLGDTGYLALNATFNFATAGRYSVGLGVTTPDGVTLNMPLTVGVDPAERTTLALSGESVTVASTYGTAIAIGTDKKVYSWGYNDYGNLGLPRAIANSRPPTKLVLPETLTPLTVSAYRYASFILDTDGKVWVTGEGYLLNNTSDKIYSPVRMTTLARWNIRDIAIASHAHHGVALTSTGQVIAIGRNFTPVLLKAFAGLTIKKIGITNNYAFALDTLGNLYQFYIDENAYQSVAKVTQLSNVSDFRTTALNDSNWEQMSVTTANGDLYYRRTARADQNLSFMKVTLPVGITMKSASVMAGYGPLFVVDTTGVVWQTNINQTTTTLEQAAWTRFSAAALGRVNSQDLPIFNDKGGWFLGFTSGRTMHYQNDDWSGGRCGYSWQGDDKTVTVISQGQFGPALNIDQRIENANTFVTVGTESEKRWYDGTQLGVEPGSDLTIKLKSFYSRCFYGNQMKVVADLDGSGQFATATDISYENNDPNVTISTVAPQSGRRAISLRIITPLGTTMTFTLNVGAYANTPNTLVTSKTSVFHADYNASTVRGTDGKIYSWGGINASRRLLSESLPRSASQPVAINLLGSTSLRDAMVLGYGNEAVVLAVSPTGKTYIWGARPGLNMPASGYSSGSVPTTPTEIPGLIGVDVVRIDGTTDRVVALTSGGVVYEWGDGNNRAPYRVAGLAGLTIVDIWSTGALNMALSSTGDLYTWRGAGDKLGWSTPSGDYWISAYWNWDPNNPIRVGKVPVGEAVKKAALTPYGVLVISATDKLYLWGQFANFTTYQPVQRNLPGGRTPGAIGNGVGNYGTIVATDGTWWNPSSDSNDLLNFIRYQNIEIETATGLLNSGVVDFARGSGRAVIKSDGTLVTYNENHGTCGNVNNSFGRVMSDGQLGPIFKDDALGIYVSQGGGTIRPGTATSMSLTAYSNCFGGESLTVSADLTGTGVFTNPTLGTVSEDGNNAISTFNFTITRPGFITMGFKVTSASGLTATTTSNVSVVPLPPAGRLIGISINGGARYTNTQDVIVDLVWPDGVTSITVSNDGGFAPGTFQVVDVQEHINWQLPPQAVIPLPAIVYARFGDSTSYFFDDIIVDSISPVLTYVAAR